MMTSSSLRMGIERTCLGGGGLVFGMGRGVLGGDFGRGGGRRGEEEVRCVFLVVLC